MVLSFPVTYALEYTTQRQERSPGATSETSVSWQEFQEEESCLPSCTTKAAALVRSGHGQAAPRKGWGKPRRRGRPCCWLSKEKLWRRIGNLKTLKREKWKCLVQNEGKPKQHTKQGEGGDGKGGEGRRQPTIWKTEDCSMRGKGLRKTKMERESASLVVEQWTGSSESGLG